MWDSTAETRFIVLPMRPAGTEGWSEDKLADLVTRDSMIGTGLPLNPGQGKRSEVMDGVHDMGGMDGFGKVEVETERAAVSRAVGRPRARDAARHGLRRRLAHRSFALRAGEAAAGRPISSASYYQRWVLAMESNVTERGYATPEELKAGHALTPGKNLPRKLTPDVIGARA